MLGFCFPNVALCQPASTALSFPPSLRLFLRYPPPRFYIYLISFSSFCFFFFFKKKITATTTNEKKKEKKIGLFSGIYLFARSSYCGVPTYIDDSQQLLIGFFFLSLSFLRMSDLYFDFLGSFLDGALNLKEKNCSFQSNLCVEALALMYKQKVKYHLISCTYHFSPSVSVCPFLVLSFSSAFEHS